MAQLKSASRIFRKVLHGELDAFRVRLDSDLGNRVHIDADEVVGRDIAFRLDVDGDLPDNELIYTLQKRNSGYPLAQSERGAFFRIPEMM